MRPSLLLQLFCVIWLATIFVFSVATRDDWPSVSSTRDEVALQGIVYDILEQGGIRQTVRVVVADVPGRVQARIGGISLLHIGDRVRVACKPTPIRDVYAETFRYDRYLAKERVSLLCDSYASPEVVGFELIFQSRMARIRDGFEVALSRVLPEPHRSLLVGLLYGARSMLPSDVVEDFRRTGTMHIVAVSGFNVMIVTEALFWTLTVFMRRQRAFFIIVIGLVAYVLFAGAGPGVVRAAIMGGLVLLARQLGRPRATLTLFLIAACAMVAINPRILLDDVGFQLSFAAAAGLTWLSPRIAPRLSWITPSWMRSILSDTLAAIAATMPISLLQFHQFALVAPIANLFIVPLVAPTMIVGAVLSLLSMAVGAVGFDGVATVIMLPVYAMLDIILALVHAFSPLPFLDLTL